MTVRHTVGTAASYTLPAVGAFVPSLMLHHRSARVHEQSEHAASRGGTRGAWDGATSVRPDDVFVCFVSLLLRRI